MHAHTLEFAAAAAERSSRGRSPLPVFLSALQVFDSAFPSGRYTLSHGLETLTQSGQLGRHTHASHLFDLLAGQIEFGVATSDGIALAHAHRAVADGAVDTAALSTVDLQLSAAKLMHEARATSLRTGRALLRTAQSAFGPMAEVQTLTELVQSRSTPGNHAVVIGVITAAVGIDVVDAIAGELWAFATSWTSACTRLGLLDHRQAQALLRQVQPQIDRSARESCVRAVDEIASSTPLLDVMAMRHEQADVRIFAN